MPRSKKALPLEAGGKYDKKQWDEIGREFGVHPNLVGQWKREVQEHAAGLFEVKRGPKPVDPLANPEQLYAEIGRLKVELGWLKKKVGPYL